MYRRQELRSLQILTSPPWIKARRCWGPAPSRAHPYSRIPGLPKRGANSGRRLSTKLRDNFTSMVDIFGFCRTFSHNRIICFDCEVSLSEETYVVIRRPSMYTTYWSTYWQWKTRMRSISTLSHVPSFSLALVMNVYVHLQLKSLWWTSGISLSTLGSRVRIWSELARLLPELSTIGWLVY